MIPPFLNIFGIGKKRANSLLAALGISPLSHFDQLPPFKKDLLLNSLTDLKKHTVCMNLNQKPLSLLIDTPLKNSIRLSFNFWTHNSSYRGARLKLGYPVRSGRTRSNARTAKKLNSSRLREI